MGYLAAIANHLWQSTLFAGAIWLLARLLKKNAASVRYAVWMAASVKFLVPFALLMSLGSHFAWKAAPQIVQAPAAAVMEEIGQPFATSDAAVESTPDVAANIGALTESGLAASQTISLLGRVMESLPQILFALWLCGVIVSLGFWARWMLRMRELRSSGTAMDMGTPIQVLSSPIQMEPCVFGLFRPVLMLPEGITERLTAAEMEAVIAHELSHVQRRDNLTAAVHFFIETAFWFWPVLRWVRMKLIEERERACDEAVLRVVPEPSAYAEGILKVCRLYLATQSEVAAGVSGSNLKQRIEGIVNYRETLRMSIARKLVLTVFSVAAVAAPFGIGTVHAPVIFAQSLRPFASPVAASLSSREEGMSTSSQDVPPDAKNTDAIRIGWQLLHTLNSALPASQQNRELQQVVGRTVTLSGVMEPRSQWITKSNEFVLAPYIAPSGNVPPPAPNQMVYVTMRGGARLEADGQPVLVTGVLRTTTRFEDVAYEIDAIAVQPYRLEAMPQTDQAQNETLCAVGVAGNDRMPAAAVLSKVSFHEGDRYDPSEVQGSFNSLWNTGSFEYIHIEHLNTPKCVRLVITVREKANFQLAGFTSGVAAGGRVDRTPSQTSGSSTMSAWQVAAGRKMSFEVASIRQSHPGSRTMANFANTVDDSYVAGANDSYVADSSVLGFVEFAYKLKLSDDQKHVLTANLPEWVSKDTFVIRAKAPASATKDQMRLMVQTLLAERVKLAVHFDQKEEPVTALSLLHPGKLGPKLRPHAEGPSCDASGLTPAERANVFPADCDLYRTTITPEMSFMEGARNTTMSVLAASFNSMPMAKTQLEDPFPYPVVDQTGLDGKYDFTLEWSPDQTITAANGRVFPPGVAPTILKAIEQQLGLKVVSTKAQLNTLVIDHVERPTEN